MDIEQPWKPLHKIVSSGDLVILIAGNHFFPVKNGSFSNARSHEETIRAAAFNEDGTLLITGGDDKDVVVWDTKTWATLGKRKSEKKVTGVAIQDSKVIWSDRTGTVFITDLDNFCKKPEEQTKCGVLLGHCSWITEMVIVPHQKTHLILTSDRDDKIRVSYYPDGYDILSYCLGHTSFVSTICVFPGNDPLLFSGGADNAVYIWDHTKGTLLSKFSLSYTFPQEDGTLRQIIVLNDNHIAVLIEEHNAVEVLKVTGSTLSHSHSIKLASRPFAIAVVANQLLVSTIDGLFEVDAKNELKALEISKQVENFFEPKNPETFDSIFADLSMKMLRRYFGTEQNNEKKSKENPNGPPAKKKRKRVGGKNVNAPKK